MRADYMLATKVFRRHRPDSARSRAEHGARPAQVALAWLVARPEVTAPIVGATIVSHLEDAIAAVKLTVSEEEIRRLQEPYRPHAIAGHQ